MKKHIVVEIIYMTFILLFLYTGIMKLIDHERFNWALNKSPLLNGAAPILAWLIPAAEILTVICLINRKTRRIGLFSFLTLMSTFTIYIGYMLYSGLKRPCTCGGVIEYMSWHQHFYFNIAFILLGLLSFLLEKIVQQIPESQIRNQQPQNRLYEKDIL